MIRPKSLLPLSVSVHVLLALGCSEPEGEPAQSLPTKYVVQPGDNLTNIAIKFYGDERERKRLFEANQDVLETADYIGVGQILRIPALNDDAIADSPLPNLSSAAGGQKTTEVELPTEYRVQPGDNLTQIAIRFYGHDQYKHDIIEANLEALENPDHIRIGQVLTIPALSKPND